MKISWKWLKEFVDIPFSLQETAEKLTMTGLEVEDIIIFEDNIPKNVITAEISSIKNHPESDKLQVVEVFTGKEKVRVVSGAPNLEIGKKVVFAPAGTTLPAGKVEKRKIRGIESAGLLCCDADFDIVDESEDIIFLDDEVELGKYAGDYIETEEAVLEIGITPNRADCLNVIGVAREISAITGNSIKIKKPKFNEIKTPSSHLISIEIKSPELCPSYTARVIEDVKIAPSPLWMVKRLKASGLRSVNNVVDITNYILIETGHPLHAFDYDLIEGKKIIVRTAYEGEKIVTLDGVERALENDMLVIADERKAIAIAGIMGGEETEVRNETTKLLIESAYFTPSSIRKTSKALGLSTEASYRFERGSDAEILEYASDRVSSLIAELADGKICAGIVKETKRKPQKPIIPLRRSVVKKVLGIDIPMEKSANILENLGMTVKTRDAEGISVTPPSYRNDIEKEIDLVEEVARIHGYENIPVKYPFSQAGEDGKIPGRIKTITDMRAELVRIGFSEIINYSFINPALMEKISGNKNNAVELKNPLSEEQSVMRTSLIEGILSTLSLNEKRYIHNLKIFEIGRVYLPEKGTIIPNERVYLAGLMSGKANSISWYEKERDVDFFDIKGVLESLADSAGLELKLKELSQKKKFLNISESADVMINDVKCGYVGRISSLIIDELELRGPVYVFEIDIDAIDFGKVRKESFKPLSKIPPSYRDLSIIVDENLTAEQILEVVKKSAGNVLEDVCFFDIYRGASIPKGKKSVAISLTFRGIDKTLTDEEISSIMERILISLKENVSAQIRS